MEKQQQPKKINLSSIIANYPTNQPTAGDEGRATQQQQAGSIQTPLCCWFGWVGLVGWSSVGRSVECKRCIVQTVQHVEHFEISKFRNFRNFQEKNPRSRVRQTKFWNFEIFRNFEIFFLRVVAGKPRAAFAACPTIQRLCTTSSTYYNITLLQKFNCARQARSQTTDITDHHHHKG